MADLMKFVQDELLQEKILSFAAGEINHCLLRN
jgi:hypothetical protein